MIKLYDFPASGSAFRTRIALNLKRIPYERISVDILKGEQFSQQYLTVNPLGLLPSLVVDGRVFTESLAIVELLEEMYPDPALLPRSPADRARVRAISLAIACGVQPLHAPRVAGYVANEIGLPPDKVQSWCTHWIETGVTAVEKLLAVGDRAGKFCHGDTITLADVVLVPQIYAGANRFKMNLERTAPTAWRIYQTCMAMPEFESAAPHASPKEALHKQ